jgi:hypothetical protein
MPDSIKVARIALVVAAGLEIATSVLFLFIFISGAILVGWGTERAGLLGSAVLGATGIFLAVLFATIGVADLLIASGIAKGRTWSRYAGTAVAVLLLIAVPVGTVLGVLALQGLLGRDARDWFAAPRFSPPAFPVPPRDL